MRQRRPILIIAGQVQSVRVNLFRVVGFLARQRTHLCVSLAALPGLPQVA